jgi:hypothetical protein
MSSASKKTLLSERRNIKRLRIQSKFDVRATFFSYDQNMSDCHIFEGRIFDVSHGGVAFQITEDILGSDKPDQIRLSVTQRVVFLLDIPDRVSWSTYQQERYNQHFATNRIVLGGEIVRNFTNNDGILRYAAKFDAIVDGELVRSLMEKALTGLVTEDDTASASGNDTEPKMLVFLSRVSENDG